MIEKLTDIINQRFTNWSFVGSIVDWYYFNGQVLIKDFDIITSDPFEPDYISSVLGPRMSFKAMGRNVDVFQEEPTETKMPTIEQRITKLEWVISILPHRREKCESLIERYRKLGTKKPQPRKPKPTTQVKQVKQLPVCKFLGEQIETIVCNVCGEGKGQNKSVYACSIHGKCTPRQVRHGQKRLNGIHVCLGCEEEIPLNEPPR